MPKRIRKRKRPEPEVQEQQPFDETERIIEGYKMKIKSPITAIRANCVECMGGAVREIAACTSKTCALYAFRMGVNTMDARSIKAKQGKGEA